MTTSTAAFLAMATGTDATMLSRLPIAEPFILVASALNACIEEFAFRSVLLARLQPILGDRQANWLQATLFGLRHYFGTQSGPLGVVMAGFLGWLNGKTSRLLWVVSWSVRSTTAAPTATNSIHPPRCRRRVPGRRRGRRRSCHQRGRVRARTTPEPAPADWLDVPRLALSSGWPVLGCHLLPKRTRPARQWQPPTGVSLERTSRRQQAASCTMPPRGWRTTMVALGMLVSAVHSSQLGAPVPWATSETWP
jgi:hypothetical protein